MQRKKRRALFQCLECGKKFFSTATAEKALLHGCPNCNGSDIDLYVSKK